MQKLLITDYLSPNVVKTAKTIFDVTESYDIPTANLMKIIGQYDALICRSQTQLTENVIQEGITGRLKIVVSVTSGMAHIDIAYAQKVGLKVCNTPWGVTNANAEFNIGALIALTRKFVSATDYMRQGIWDQQKVIGNEISGKNLGIVSFGRIGKKTAQYASAFDMRIFAYDPYVERKAFAQAHVQRVGLVELMSESDFIIVNVALTPDTINMITAKELTLMKPTAYIVQVSRGRVIDESALIEALRTHAIAGALIDVYVNEPHFDSRFTELSNVILTPHIACSTLEAREIVGEFALDEVKRFFVGENLQSEFVPPKFTVTQ